MPSNYVPDGLWIELWNSNEGTQSQKTLNVEKYAEI